MMNPLGMLGGLGQSFGLPSSNPLALLGGLGLQSGNPLGLMGMLNSGLSGSNPMGLAGLMQMMGSSMGGSPLGGLMEDSTRNLARIINSNLLMSGREEPEEGDLGSFGIDGIKLLQMLFGGLGGE